MAIKYYPLTRIKTDLYTRGTTYKLPNGEPYVGRYYLTYDGKAYTGANPAVGTNQELIRMERSIPGGGQISTVPSNNYNIGNSQNTLTAVNLNNALNNQQLQELEPYYPVLLESDYQIGYFTRYFAKKVTGPGYIFEISKTQFANIQNNTNPIDFLVYESTSILWQLTGPLRDTRVSQYQIKGGIIDTNKRVTEQRALTFRGLVEYIGNDYTKFARPTT
jgi:hypothetical protein